MYSIDGSQTECVHSIFKLRLEVFLYMCSEHYRRCQSDADSDIVQAHLAQLALGDIFAALEVHQDQADLQAKGLVALGVLGQARTRPSSAPDNDETFTVFLPVIALTCCSTVLDMGTSLVTL